MTVLRIGTLLLAVVTALFLTARTGVAEDPQPIRLDSTTDATAYCARVQAAFIREDFEVLEATAERARQLQTRFPGGKAELQVFYESFGTEACNQVYVYLNEESGQARVAIGESWLGEKPNSTTARIASAMIWSQFAWAGRGRGYANEVSADQWATFSNRIKRAAQFMRNVDPNRDAEAYLVLLDLARDLNVPRPQIDTIFRRAKERFPAYLGYYADYASILLPKWLGQPGELSEYLESLLDDPGGDVGAMAYSRAAERISFDLGSSSDIYRDTGLTWENVRRGFSLREARDGLNKRAWISLCYYASTAADRKVAREAYRHITHIDEWPVGGIHRFFLTVLPWMMQRD
jgi:hypothetical protein